MYYSAKIHLAYIIYSIKNMSFFNKIFGGQKKEPKTAAGPPKPVQESTQAKKVKIEAACVALDNKIHEFEDKEKKFEHKIDLLKNKAKELLQADKKKKLRNMQRKLPEFRNNQRYIEFNERAIH